MQYLLRLHSLVRLRLTGCKTRGSHGGEIAGCAGHEVAISEACNSTVSP